MREILFRGKDANTLKWAYGVPVKTLTNSCTEKIELVRKIEYETDFMAHTYADSTPIIQETLGEFTGLVDINGQKIFEGDVLEENRKRHIPGDKPYRVVIRFEDSSFCFKCTSRTMWTPIDDDAFGIDTHDFFVAGNIYDNPNLLMPEN